MTHAPELPIDTLGVSAVMEPEARRIPASEFKQLMVSHRRLSRADQPHLGLRGLKDLDSGEWFLTEERKLYESKRS